MGTWMGYGRSTTGLNLSFGLHLEGIGNDGRCCRMIVRAQIKSPGTFLMKNHRRDSPLSCCKCDRKLVYRAALQTSSEALWRLCKETWGHGSCPSQTSSQGGFLKVRLVLNVLQRRPKWMPQTCSGWSVQAWRHIAPECAGHSAFQAQAPQPGCCLRPHQGPLLKASHMSAVAQVTTQPQLESLESDVFLYLGQVRILSFFICAILQYNREEQKVRYTLAPLGRDVFTFPL